MDIVKRVRLHWPDMTFELAEEVADEIERLREVLKKTLDVARRNELGDYIQSAEAALQQKDQGQ